MSEIKVNNGNIEDALKRFKRQCARNGVLQEVRKREHYEKPSVKRKKKSEAFQLRILVEHNPENPNTGHHSTDGVEWSPPHQRS